MKKVKKHCCLKIVYQSEPERGFARFAKEVLE